MNGTRKKVVAFDSWTVGGSMHLTRLVEPLGEAGIDLMLLHLGSWGHDVGRPDEERIGNLLTRDIRYYRGLSIPDVLAAEKPDAVMFLSTTAFAHRAINRYCRQAGIPTLHLYHGLVGVQSSLPHPMSARRQVALMADRVGKNVRRIWPLYLRSLQSTRAPASEWGGFVRDLWLQATGRAFFRVAPRDSSTTACAVYAEADVEHAVTRYRMPRDAVHVVGNIDLARFGLAASDLSSCVHRAKPATNEVLYIDTALIEAGVAFGNADECVGHLVATRDALASQGLRLVLKPHPALARTGVLDQIRNEGIATCDNSDFVPRLRDSRGAIGEPSSAALLPALLGLPLLLARYGRLRNLRYGPVLESYPRAGALTSVESAAEDLESLAARDPEGTEAWVRQNAGPLPADEMPARVTQVLASIMAPGR